MALSDLINAFRPGVAAAPTPPAGIPAAAAVTSQTATSATTAPNGTIPGAGAPGAVTVKTGIDAFDGLWELPKPKDGEASGPTPLFTGTPETMLEAARKTDFRTAATPEQISAITKGGPDALNAMLELMNDMTQKAFAQSAHASTRLITSALDKSEFARVSDLSTHIKRNTVRESLRADNPLYSHPAVAPLLAGLESQLLVKHPDATSAEITQMARDYFGGVTDMFTAPARAEAAANAKKTSGETDWSKF